MTVGNAEQLGFGVGFRVGSDEAEDDEAEVMEKVGLASMPWSRQGLHFSTAVMRGGFAWGVDLGRCDPGKGWDDGEEK